MVATPIGNLRDMTLRAIDILSCVDIIYAEDTRHSKTLLAEFDIRTPLRSLHEHNELEQTENLLETLKQGSSIAIISDAGTPLISDPGYTSIHQLAEAGIKIVPVPGVCAAITALSVAGLPTDRFLFKGFLPSKSAARQTHLQDLKAEPGTLVFYEGKHRLLEMLEDLSKVLGDTRRAVIGRELTKQFETFYRGSLSDVKHQIRSSENAQKGEFVVLVQGYQEATDALPQTLGSISTDAFIRLLKEHLPDKHIAQVLAKLSAHGKRDWYSYLIELGEKH